MNALSAVRLEHQRNNERNEITRARAVAAHCARRNLQGHDMANYSRWEGIKKKHPEPASEVRAGIEHGLALGQLIYDLRTAAGLSQRALAERTGTTQSVISRLEEGGGAKRSYEQDRRGANR